MRFDEQQNFRNLEFGREILEFSEKSFHFDGGNLEFPLSLEEKTLFFLEKTLSSEEKNLGFFLEKPLSLENFLSLDCLEFSKNR